MYILKRQIGEDEIARKDNIQRTLEYICQQLGRLNIVKIILNDFGRSDVTNRAMDIRSASMWYLPAQIRHDTTRLGTLGTSNKYSHSLQ